MMPRYKKQRRYRRNRESFPIIPLAVLSALVLSQANIAVIAKWVAAIFGALLGLALLVVVVKLCIRRSNTRAHLVSSAKDIAPAVSALRLRVSARVNRRHHHSGGGKA